LCSDFCVPSFPTRRSSDLGCLPMLLQMPFLIALYYAIRRTPEIMKQSFLWFHLGEIDILLIIVTICLYALQALVMLEHVSKEQRDRKSTRLNSSHVSISYA